MYANSTGEEKIGYEEEEEEEAAGGEVEGVDPQGTGDAVRHFGGGVIYWLRCFGWERRSYTKT